MTGILKRVLIYTFLVAFSRQSEKVILIGAKNQEFLPLIIWQFTNKLVNKGWSKNMGAIWK